MSVRWSGQFQLPFSYFGLLAKVVASMRAVSILLLVLDNWIKDLYSTLSASSFRQGLGINKFYSILPLFQGSWEFFLAICNLCKLLKDVGRIVSFSVFCNYSCFKMFRAELLEQWIYKVISFQYGCKNNQYRRKIWINIHIWKDCVNFLFCENFW